MAGKSIINKEELLKVAITMVEECGLDSINARSLAKNADISTKPIYRIYSSLDLIKEDLNTIIKKEYDEFIKHRVDNKNALISVCVAYIEFAKNHKNFFKALFLSNNLGWTKVEDVLNEKWNQGAIINIVNKYGLSFASAKDIFMNVWLYATGLATLIACNNLILEDKEIKERITKIFNDLVKDIEVKKK